MEITKMPLMIAGRETGTFAFAGLRDSEIDESLPRRLIHETFGLNRRQKIRIVSPTKELQSLVYAQYACSKGLTVTDQIAKGRFGEINGTAGGDAVVKACSMSRWSADQSRGHILSYEQLVKLTEIMFRELRVCSNYAQEPHPDIVSFVRDSIGVAVVVNRDKEPAEACVITMFGMKDYSYGEERPDVRSRMSSSGGLTVSEIWKMYGSVLNALVSLNHLFGIGMVYQERNFGGNILVSGDRIKRFLLADFGSVAERSAKHRSDLSPGYAGKKSARPSQDVRHLSLFILEMLMNASNRKKDRHSRRLVLLCLAGILFFRTPEQQSRRTNRILARYDEEEPRTRAGRIRRKTGAGKAMITILLILTILLGIGYTAQEYPHVYRRAWEKTRNVWYTVSDKARGIGYEISEKFDDLKAFGSIEFRDGDIPDEMTEISCGSIEVTVDSSYPGRCSVAVCKKGKLFWTTANAVWAEPGGTVALQVPEGEFLLFCACPGENGHLDQMKHYFNNGGEGSKRVCMYPTRTAGELEAIAFAEEHKPGLFAMLGLTDPEHFDSGTNQTSCNRFEMTYDPGNDRGRCCFAVCRLNGLRVEVTEAYWTDPCGCAWFDAPDGEFVWMAIPTDTSRIPYFCRFSNVLSEDTAHYRLTFASEN